MSDKVKPAKGCPRCTYWDRGLCRHGLAAEHDAERGRGGGPSCPYFTRDYSAFAFFVKEWRS